MGRKKKFNDETAVDNLSTTEEAIHETEITVSDAVMTEEAPSEAVKLTELKVTPSVKVAPSTVSAVATTVVRAKLVGEAVLPKKQTEGAAGFDLVAIQDISIPPRGGRALVSTGVYLAIPAGWEGQVRSRSGLALNNGVIVLNAPGTIDSDYRGEVGVILVNFGPVVHQVKAGDRIAQLVFCPVPRVVLHRVTNLDDTSRGDGGFGSTGN